MASKWDDPKERQIVFASAKFGDTGAVREAVLGGFPPTAVDQNAYTLLHHVVCAKVNSLVPFLLEHGWDVNARTNDEGMPVHYACGRGQVEVVQWLVQAGASLNAVAKEGVTPVHIAACYDRKDRVQMLEWLATRVEVDWHHQLDKGSNALKLLDRFDPTHDECQAIVIAAMAAQRAREARWTPLRAAFVGAVAVVAIGVACGKK
jgi:hypothetical protein